MMTTPFPENYAQWQHCITVECGIPLTAEYVAARLEIWRNPQSEETLRFRRLYGDAYWQQVLQWFEQAEQEFAAGDALGDALDESASR